jgi:hypothetical protein
VGTFKARAADSGRRVAGVVIVMEHGRVQAKFCGRARDSVSTVANVYEGFHYRKLDSSRNHGVTGTPASSYQRCSGWAKEMEMEMAYEW